ncbi:unnamed protein product, partial [Brenthis ino]
MKLVAHLQKSDSKIRVVQCSVSPALKSTVTGCPALSYLQNNAGLMCACQWENAGGKTRERTVSVGPRVAEAARHRKPTLRPGAKRTPRWTRRHVLRIDRR